MRDTIIKAARELAKELHQGQTDKAGKDYFAEHLCHVADMGRCPMEKIVGYLHDAAEDTFYSVEQVMQMLRERCGDCLKDEHAQLISEALHALNSKIAATREEYINRVSENELAAEVKLNDLRHNIEISRIENPTEKDFERVERYKREFRKINEKQMLNHNKQN